ncbi:MAG TPA: TMEM43 family protein, partial [Thermoanaerobaculia bacterium]
ETRKKLGGGTETTKTYTYTKEWAAEPIDSSRFQRAEGHENPGAFPFEGATVIADPVKVAAFTMSKEQIDKLTDATDLKVGADAADNLPEDAKDKLKVADGRFYMGDNPSTPVLGDVRISYSTVNPSAVSLVGVQTGESFSPFQAQAGDAILLVEEGTHTAPEMFKTAQDQNAVLTWILRAVGFFVMFLGIFMVFRPIAVFADVLPFFGSMLGAGVGIFAFLLAAVLSFVTIAVAWIFVRPLLGITLLVLAGGALFWLIKKGRAKKAQRAAVVAPVPA